METKMKPQIQSTVYPETPCYNFNEWISYIRGELKKTGKHGNAQYILKREYFEMFTDALVLN
jgi:hypothetical protein